MTLPETIYTDLIEWGKVALNVGTVICTALYLRWLWQENAKLKWGDKTPTIQILSELSNSTAK